MACWFNVADVTNTHTLMCITDTAGDNDYFSLQANGAASGDPVQAAARRSSSATSDKGAYTANVWYHGAAVFASSTSRTAYLNGSAGTTNTTSIVPSSIDRNAIGVLRRATPANPTIGKIAEAAIWSVALSAGEVASLAAGANPMGIQPASLLAYLPLITDVLDYKGVSWTDASTSSNAAHPTVSHPSRIAHLNRLLRAA